MSSMLGPSIVGREQSAPRPVLPAALIALGLAAMFAPVFVNLAHTVWNTDEQGHGPIILALVVWLFWQRRQRFAAAVAQATPAGIFGWFWLALGLCMYVLGRIQSIAMLEAGSIMPLMVGALAVTFGWRTVRIAAFPIFFLLFSVPMPGPLVDMLTQPLKQAVSYVAEQILYAAGYPISRTGVTLMVGPYQLLVADACAGLNSMFTLEALGLFYMNIVGHTSKLRNTLLVFLIVPMSFCANVVRVLILVLITYYLGDEAGQGFVHGAAGLVLFVVALVTMFAVDSFMGIFFRRDAEL